MLGNFCSKLLVFIVDIVMKWVEIVVVSGESVELYFFCIFKNICEKWWLYEEINVKWYKFVGLLLLCDNDGQLWVIVLDDVELL